ncbi:MAG: hypothetical protein PSV18_09685 [Methylobacter sp.]|nr:hypothetical protein [Candidatus Methylobacter titanis]
MNLTWKILALALACSFAPLAAATACDPDCSQKVDELVRQAASLNAGRRYTEAADLLERVLMQYPDVSGAAEQYNRALAGIDSQDVTQPQHQPSQSEVPQQPWQINAGLQMRGGYSSNLNQAPSQSSIQLTLPSGPVTVELQPQFRQQAGFGVETQLSANAVRTLADNRQWQVRGELFNRETGYSGYADYQGTNLLTSLIQQGDGGTETGAALGFSALRYGGDVYLYTVQMMLRHAGKQGAYCKPQAGIDVLWQRQHGNPLLDSRYGGLMAGMLCNTRLGLYNAAISAGWDWASSQRPGGDQQRVKLEVAGIWLTDAIRWGSFVKARADILQSNDLQAYSPWLSHGAGRDIRRIGAGLDYDWPLTPIAGNWRGVASVQWQQQHSNISLFETDALEGWLGVRVAW